MTDHPKVRAGLRSFYKFPRQAPGSDRVEVTRREGGKLGLKSIFSIFILSIIMTLMLSRSFLSVTGYMSPKLLSFIAQSLNLGEFGYYLVTLTIDAASYSIILLLVTTSIMHYTTISVKFRELTESEARLGNLRPLSSDVIARLVEKHDVIADNLNTRVLSLQARATMIYWTILLTLAVGVLLVIFAGYLSSFDTESNMLWLRLDNEFSRAYAGGSSAGGSSDAIQRYSKHYDDVLNASIADMVARNSQGRIWNWPSTILRVSVVALLIFLVQILIQLYRFNSLLIVFYSARRDAIIMSAGDLVAAKQWDAVFAPENVDFGREPRHPFFAIATLFGKRRSDDEPEPGEMKPNAKPDKANASRGDRPPRKRHVGAPTLYPGTATDKGPPGGHQPQPPADG